MVTKFNNLGLEEYCKENQITLTKDYTEIKVTRDTIIQGLCKKNCGKEFEKNFRRLVSQSGPICLDCLKNFTSFDIKYLLKYSKDNNITLIGEYKNVTRETKITGKCNGQNCSNNFEKNFRYLVEEGGPYCIDCTSNNKLEKFKKEMNNKYGCDFYLQSKEGKEKLKNIFMEKYGVENISQNKEIRKKIEKTFIENYGVKHPSQTQEIKDKIIKTNTEKYGVKNPMQNEFFKNKLKNTNLEKYGTISPLQNKEVMEKTNKTNIEKYGTKFPSQNNMIKQKVVKTNLIKFGTEYPLLNVIIKEKSFTTLLNNYGVQNPLHSEEIKNKIKQTNIKKYGFEYVYNSPEIREKINQTIFEKYGVDHISKSPEIREKVTKTILEKYGVDHIFKSPEIRKKVKQTNLEKYGVENVSQNSEIMDKISKNAYKRKTFKSKSGKEYGCQGYEPYALKIITEDMEISDENIITGPSNVPHIKYIDDEDKEHIHYPDIYLNNQNKLIEVKSTWTLEKKRDSIFAKQKAAKEKGYEYEIWVISHKGTILEKFI